MQLADHGVETATDLVWLELAALNIDQPNARPMAVFGEPSDFHSAKGAVPVMVERDRSLGIQRCETAHERFSESDVEEACWAAEA